MMRQEFIITKASDDRIEVGSDLESGRQFEREREKKYMNKLPEEKKFDLWRKMGLMNEVSVLEIWT